MRPGPDPAAGPGRCAGSAPAEAVIFTSFHQSPLPTALVLADGRSAADQRDQRGLPRLAARRAAPAHRRHPGGASATCPWPGRPGSGCPPGDPGTLAVTGRCRTAGALTGGGRYVVVHPGASVPARRAVGGPDGGHDRRALAAAGHRVVVTGSAAERRLAAAVRRARRTVPGRGGPVRPDQPAHAGRGAGAARTWPSRRTPARRTWPPRWAPRW